MKKVLRFLFAGGICFQLFPNAVKAKEQCLLVPLAIERKVDQSVLIVEGKVKEQRSFYDESRGRIYTSNIIAVYKVFKGAVTEQTIEIITDGGVVGLEKQEFSSLLSLSIGQTGIFFCETANVPGIDGAAAYRAYGSMQGFVNYYLDNGAADVPFAHYRKISDARTAISNVTKTAYQTIATDAALQMAEQPRPKPKTTAVPTITSFSPLVASAGTGTILTITGTNFGASRGTGHVDFRNANDGGATFVQALLQDYISWSNTQIVLRIPSNIVTPEGCAGTGNIRVVNSDPNSVISTTPLTITFAYTNLDYNNNNITYTPDLINDNAAGGYTFQLYTGFNSNTDAVSAFRRAMSTWCPTQVNWIIGSTTSTNVTASDGINIVRFDVGGELPDGVLGVLGSYYQGCSSGGNLVWHVSEMDMTFNDATNWEYGPALPSFTEYDFESVAVHELGHGLQLNHVINTLDVMHYALGNGDANRSVNIDDVAGGTAVMANSVVANACGPGAMTIKNCLLPVQLISFTGKYQPGEGALLEWETALQEEIYGYEIERSTDAIHFDNIGFVKSSNKQDNYYSFLDKEMKGNAYYRLIIKKLNGTMVYSNTVYLNIREAGRTVAVYPNPVKDVITVNIDKDIEANSSFVLISADGRVVLTQSLNMDNNIGEVNIPIGHIAQGVYIYHVQTPSGNYSGKLLKELD